MSAKRRKPKPCAGCAHYRSSTGSRGGEEICHYILDTGEPRGCPPERCDKRVKRCDKRVKQIPRLETPFDYEAYEIRRARLCGDKERAIFKGRQKLNRVDGI